MREKIHTIPVVESFEAGDECPFCHLLRQTEQRTIRYFAGPGASYMEPEVRGNTNREGFCPSHLQKLYDYGNALGAALMLQTHCEDILLDLVETWVVLRGMYHISASIDSNSIHNSKFASGAAQSFMPTKVIARCLMS